MRLPPPIAADFRPTDCDFGNQGIHSVAVTLTLSLQLCACGRRSVQLACPMQPPGLKKLVVMGVVSAIGSVHGNVLRSIGDRVQSLRLPPKHSARLPVNHGLSKRHVRAVFVLASAQRNAPIFRLRPCFEAPIKPYDVRALLAPHHGSLAVISSVVIFRSQTLPWPPRWS